MYRGIILYGIKNENENKINCFSPSALINRSRYKLAILNPLKDKTGIYIFLDSEFVPVYIGIGGQKTNGQNLKIRLGQELRAHVKKGQSTEYSKDSGATLSKNIQEIDKLLTQEDISADTSIETIKGFKIITLAVGDIDCEKDVLNARALETVLISLFHPKYNK